MRWLGALVLLPVCLAYKFTGGEDYFLPCSDARSTQLWVTCNLKPVIEENAFNSTRDIIQNITTQVEGYLEKQGQMLERILTLVNGLSEVEKPLDCAGFGDSDSGYKTIYPVSCSQPESVYCHRDNERLWTAILRRDYNYEPNVDFFRPWADYRQGFGNREHNHWIGLENLHHMTKDRDFVLSFEGYDYDRNHAKGLWREFRVLGEDTQYKLEIGNFSSNSDSLKDCLTELNGQMFSTFDRDNDAYSTDSCAKQWMGGWWYNDCGKANPTGPHANTGKHNSTLWTGWGESMQVSLAELGIYVRPKEGQPLFRKCYGKDGMLEPFTLN